MYRTHTCGELRLEHKGNQTTLAGWVQTVRKFGAITFVDLRDRYGITQLLFGEALTKQLDENPLGREFVLQATGIVNERSNKNPNLPTGDIEIIVSEFNILNKSAVPPFTIQDDTDGGDDLRMKYRYLDLRRNAVKKNLELRYAVNRAARNYLHTQGFMDIETPFLIKSTPEGARDFVVPSRMNGGQFYALPQSPQTFKQLLMVSGYDRYYQVVKCFRDEDLRADRQPEFTQIDCEMAFVEQEDILNMFEGMVKHIFKEVKNIDYTEAVPRMTWEDAMWQYGNDKPDIRFDMKLLNLKKPATVYTEKKDDATLINGADFKVFDEAETVLAISVPGCSEYSRKQTDELTEWVKRPQIGMKGLVFIKVNTDGSYKSSVDKFYSSRHSPTPSPAKVQGPIATRTSRNVGWPTLAVIRRTWRFLPSHSTISIQLVGTDLRKRTGGSRGHSQSGAGMRRAAHGKLRKSPRSTPARRIASAASSISPSTCTR